MMPIECDDCGGAGWVDSHSLGSRYKRDGYHIEKCDTCDRFKSDQEALDWVIITHINVRRRRPVLLHMTALEKETDAYRNGFEDGRNAAIDCVHKHGE